MTDLDLRRMGIEETFNVFKTEDDGSIDYQEIENKVINGVQLKFSLFDVINRRANIKYEKEAKGIIVINRKIIPMIAFDLEMLEREKIMKDYLIEKMEKKPLAKIRGLEE